MTTHPVGDFDDAARERATHVLRHASSTAQIVPPADQFETAVDALWVDFEAMVAEHFAPSATVDGQSVDRGTSLGDRWQRMVVTAITNGFILTGGFLTADDMIDEVELRAHRSASGSLWHSRRAPAQGALVLGVNAALVHLDGSAAQGRHPDARDSAAVVEIVALATLGAVMAGEGRPRISVGGAEAPVVDGPAVDGPSGRWARDPVAVAQSFGIPDVTLIAAKREGWVCDECGCLFAGRVEGGVAYPDRFAPIGRSGPCDETNRCGCHDAPLQRRVR